MWYILHHYLNVKCKWNCHESVMLHAKEANDAEGGSREVANQSSKQHDNILGD